MDRPALSLVRAGHEPLIQIFVHGFGNESNRAYNELHSHILAARPAGRVYLFHWPSGGAELSWNPLYLARFPWKQQEAAKLGQTFRKHVAKVAGARVLPMTWVGHSLGARLIHYALEHYDWTPYHLQNVVMMGSAASATDDDWPRCADKVSGKLVNAWSKVDGYLSAKPLDKPAGLNPLPFRHPKIRNVHTGLWHTNYWPSLEWVLQRSLGADFQQHAAEIEAACPFCESKNALDPDLGVCVYRRGGCGMHYTVADDGHCYPVTNELRCPTRGCGCIGLVEDGTHALSCPDCGSTLWEPGMRVPPSRQRTP